MDPVSASVLALSASSTPDFFNNPSNMLAPVYIRSDGADAPRGFA
jgi:tRNA threonylcarbamoyladenosine biosynthesis protein TsaB